MNYISKGIQNIYTHHMNPLEKLWETDKITELLENNTSADIFGLNTDELAMDLKFLSIQERLNIDPNILESAMKVSLNQTDNSGLEEIATITSKTSSFQDEKEVNDIQNKKIVNKIIKEKPKDKTTKNEIDELDELLSLTEDKSKLIEEEKYIPKEQIKEIKKEETKEEMKVIIKQELPKEDKMEENKKVEEENLEDWLDGLL